VRAGAWKLYALYASTRIRPALWVVSKYKF
jgi:hypothetical protein